LLQQVVQHLAGFDKHDGLGSAAQFRNQAVSFVAAVRPNIPAAQIETDGIAVMRMTDHGNLRAILKGLDLSAEREFSIVSRQEHMDSDEQESESSHRTSRPGA